MAPIYFSERCERRLVWNVVHRAARTGEDHGTTAAGVLPVPARQVAPVGMQGCRTRRCQGHPVLRVRPPQLEVAVAVSIPGRQRYDSMPGDLDFGKTAGRLAV